MNSIEIYNAIGNGGPSAPLPSAHLQKPNAKLKKAPECPLLESRNWLLHLHYSRKEYGTCKIFIKEELDKSNGMCEYANYVQGLILRHEGKIQESLEYFQTCHSLNPRNIDNIKQVARSLYLLGRHRLALDAYMEAENVAGKPDWDIYHNIGICLLHLGEHTKAKEYLCRSIQLSRQQVSYVILAKIHLLENDMQGAIDIYKSALDLYPDNSDLATSLGLLYMKSGQHQRAFEKLGSALAHDSACPRALLAAGSMMQSHQDYDVALSKYKIATQYLPESNALWNNIGMCFFEKKKFVAAISCLKRANYLAPFDHKTLYNLGLVHLTTQQYASAFHFLSAAINLRSDSACTFLLLALVLRRLGDPDNARQAFEQAAKLDPNEASVPVNYAVFLYSTGELEKASVQLRKFQEVAERSKGLEQELVETASNLSVMLANKGKTVNEPSMKQECNIEENLVAKESPVIPIDISRGVADMPHELAPDEV